MIDPKEVITQIHDKIEDLSGTTECNKPFLSIFYALYSAVTSDEPAFNRASELLSELTGRQDNSPWFYNGWQGVYWSILYLNDKGLIDLNNNLRERILMFLNKFEASWGQIPNELYPSSFIWGDSLLLMSMWAEDLSYTRYLIEERIIMRLDCAEKYLDEVAEKLNYTFFNLMGCCSLIAFCVDNGIFPVKAEMLLSKAIILSNQLPNEEKKMLKCLCACEDTIYKYAVQLDQSIYPFIFNLKNLKYEFKVSTDEITKCPNLDWLICYGILILNNLEL